MKLQAGKLCVVFAALAATGLVCVSGGWAEDAVPKPTANTPGSYSVQTSRIVGDAIKADEAAAKAAEDATTQARDIQFKFAVPPGGPWKENGMAAKIRKAAEELRDAKGDDAHEKANSKLRELLDQYFEEDMTRRQKELESIEARLQKLHAQLERRREKKQEIIDLQVKMSVNEADGLGFYSQPEGGTFNLFAPQTPMMNLKYGPDGSAFYVPLPVSPPGPPSSPVPVAAPAPAPTPTR